jgi:pimeloyl-ACP methyl ester carboxylesterase/DNA-binding CsgD family transcriptional regulator
MDQHIRFAETADGLRLAYAVAGAGPPLVKAAHWLSHVEHDWQTPLWKPWLTAMADRWTLVRYDERGCGLSDREAGPFALDDWLHDLEVVVNACGLERFALTGMSQGGPIAVEYAARFPERVTHLVLYGTYLRGRARRGDGDRFRKETDTLLRLIELGWGQSGSPYSEVFASLFLDSPDAEQRRLFSELQRLSASPATAAAMVAAFDTIDVSDVARRVTVPTLVLHARGDRRVPFEEARRAASLIPGARLVALDGASHIIQKDEPAMAQFLSAVEEFLSSTSPRPTRRESALADLTDRERAVLDLVAAGMSNGAIASSLCVSPFTVRNHLTRVFSKLNVRSRAEAIVQARECGLGRGRPAG